MVLRVRLVSQCPNQAPKISLPPLTALSHSSSASLCYSKDTSKYRAYVLQVSIDSQNHRMV